MPANPVNATVTTALVALVAPGQIWFRGAAGGIIRAWAPSKAADRLEEDVRVQIYVDADNQLNGWWDPGSGLAVNQRGFDASARPRRAVSMVCRGDCGLVWEAPAAHVLIAGGERCLTCSGPLEAR